jgi:hypothetical protein
MRRSQAAASFLLASAALAIAGPRPALAQEPLDKTAREALATIARAVLLAAVDDTAKAVDLAGPALPADVRRELDAVHGASRAKDIREAPSRNLKLALLKLLIDESADAQDVQRRFTDLSGKLAGELDDLVARSAKARTEGVQLLKDASEGKYASPAAVNAGKAGPMGPLLLRMGRASPFLRGELRPEATLDARYTALVRAYEKAPDAGVSLLLAILANVETKAKGTVADAPDVRQLIGLIRSRLDAATDGTFEATSAARDATTRLRQGELTRAVSGVRSADLEYAVKLLAAYKKQFDASPALDATEIAGVYFDRNSNRVYFYLDGEDRWVAGGAHAASPSPVTTFLISAQDPLLVRRATDPRALAALYGAFGDAAPFESAAADVRKNAAAVCARVRALTAIASRGGATQEQIDRFLLEQAGYDRELAGPIPGLDDDACAQRTIERLARAVIDGPQGTGQAIAAELASALDALSKVELLAFSEVKVEAPAGVSEVTLSLVAPGLATPPLVAPPRTLVAGGNARCVLVVHAGEDPSGTTLEAEARAAGEPFTGLLVLDTAAAKASGHIEGRTLALVPGAWLQILGHRGTRVQVGERLVAKLHPDRAAHLRLEPPGGTPAGAPEETGPWTAEGGVIIPCALWAAGTWTATALDDANHAIATAKFDVDKAPGVVCQDAAGTRVVHARLGSKIDVAFFENGVALPSGPVTIGLEHETGGLAWGPKAPIASPKTTIEVPADLAPGRYRLVAQIGAVRLPPWPLALVAEEPRVSLVRDPFAVEPPPVVGSGEKVYARIEPGFALEPGEVASAIVQIESLARGTAVRAHGTPIPGFPVTGLLLPIVLKDSMPPGTWDLVADVYLGAGRIRARGKAQIEVGMDMPFALKPQDGDARDLYARGDRFQVKLSEAAGITTATFVLVGPDGLATPIEPDDQGVPAVALPSDAAVGNWEVRGSARQDGGTLERALPFRVYAPSRFTVNVKGRVGEQGLVDVPIPAGYVAPVRVKVGSLWTDGNKAIVIPIEGASSVPILLEDKNGRRADGEALIEVVPDTKVDVGSLPRPATGANFAIVANLREKTFFFPGYEAISRMLRDASVPKDWVVVAAGPLSAAETRDWVFSKVPYDGPRAANPLSVYRSKRYWANLPASVQRGFAEGGCGPETIFDVTNSPITDDAKTTLADLASRIVEQKGGWTYELERATLRAQGSVCDTTNLPRENEIVFQSTSVNVDASSVTRAVAPGALGDLELRADLPSSLVAGEPFVLAASVAAIPTTLAAGRAYPGGAEHFTPLLLAVALEGSLDVEGKSIAVATSTSIGTGAPGRELVFLGVPTRTERLEDGSARVAEDMAFSSAPGGKPGTLERRLEPVPPGVLANKPVRLTVRFKAHLSVAAPAAALPKDQPPAEGATFTWEGQSFVMDPIDSSLIQRPELELEVVYVRQSPEGAPPRAAPRPPLEPSRLTSDKPDPLPPLDAAVEQTAAEAALAAFKYEDAEAHARNALHADPSKVAAWTLVGEALVRRARFDDAVAPLARALALDPSSPRALVFYAESLAATGRAAEAREAAKKALSQKLDADLEARARKVAD